MEKYRRSTRQLASGLPYLTDPRPWPPRRAAWQASFEWIEVFCNHQRSHSAPGYRRPVTFERGLAAEAQAA